MKITVVGAGNVGATVAENMVRREFAEEIVLLDIKEGFAEGKAMDMNQTATLNGFDSKVIGSTNDYSKTAGSTVAVITSGIPRKPGMTREELIGTNARIVQMVTESLIKHSPDIIIVVISNPMDTMTYLTNKTSGLHKNRIIGMGGILDSARFKYRLSEQLNCSPNDLQAQVIGGHGDTTMIPLIKHATYNSIPVTQFLSQEQQDHVVSETMVGGKTLTGLIGTSAWYAPGAAGAELVESIVRDQKKMFPCSVLLNGEYGQDDLCIGVPVIIGKNGWERIVEFNLSSEEKELFEASAVAVRKMNAALDENL
ncbi:MAG TPA: malate dehydrogenase [Cryomorphaceae bacterium]|nr:malate dehydrogenase [Cryomorphaceae bacterium]HCY25845.1 malate dehydrogenase [Cryomorphaceae bacterium]